MAFHEDWYPEAQLAHLVRLCQYTRPLTGAMVEIGCWEGKSTVALANTCFPETLIAVDSWAGNLGEGANHPTVELLKQRDVYADFVENIRLLTRGNVQIERADCFDFIAALKEPIKFCHVDASHDYSSVKRALEMLAPMVVDGGILCGDDYFAPGAHGTDLGGDVERACRDVLPDHFSAGNFWFWRKAA